MVTRLRRYTGAQGRGQTLVEFALVIPIFILLLVAVIEFSFVFNALLSINYGSRNASLVAAEAGGGKGADCVILQSIERDVSAPADPSRITEIWIYRANRNGVPIPHDTDKNGLNVYLRTGSMTCNFPDLPTITVPYSLSGAEGYPDEGLPGDRRCNILSPRDWPGICPTNRDDVGIDTVGVQITYEYAWHTPLPGLIRLVGSGYTLVKSNAMRMEPVL